MDKAKRERVISVPSSNWAQLQKKLDSQPKPKQSKDKKKADGKGPHVKSRSALPFKGKKPDSRGLGHYMGRVEVAADAKVVISERQDEPSKSALMHGKVKVTEPCVLLELPSDDPLVAELRHMVCGNHILTESQKTPGQYLAIDCEMVGIGPNGNESALARVSIVNYHGHIILDTFVQPREAVTDYRTWISGVRASDLMGAPQFHEVEKQVSDLCEGKILVGHAIDNDLKALMLTHPGPLIRDTQKFKGLKDKMNNKKPGLAKTSESLLGIQIQMGAHSSVIDARVTMAIYRLFKKEWEKSVWHLTEAYRSKVKGGSKFNEDGAEPSKYGNKRKRGSSSEEEESQSGEEDAANEGSSIKQKKKKEQFPGGGRRGISSGLDVIVRRNGVRMDGNGRGDGSGRRGGGRGQEAAAPSSVGNWWEQSAK